MTFVHASDARLDAIVRQLDLDDWLARWRDMQGTGDPTERAVAPGECCDDAADCPSAS